MRIPITITIDITQATALRDLAHHRRRPISHLVGDALDAYMGRSSTTDAPGASPTGAPSPTEGT